MAKRGWSVLAHLACRTLLSVSLSPIPVTGSPALSGLVLFLPCDNWHLSTFPSIAWTRRVIQFRNTGLWQRAVYCRLLVPSLAMILLSRTSYARVQLRCFSAPLWNLPCFFPVTTGISRHSLALPGLDGLSSLFRDTGFWQCAVYCRLSFACP